MDFWILLRRTATLVVWSWVVVGCADSTSPEACDARQCSEENRQCDEAKPTSSCGACVAGYEEKGGACLDMDECAAGTSTCGEHSLCTNKPGGFSCSCTAGYEGDGQRCTDIDECADHAQNDCMFLDHCTNTDGSYTCSCPEDWLDETGDGSACSQITDVSVGESHVLALSSQGTMYAWGNNALGQLDPEAGEVLVEKPRRVGAARHWLKISAGEAHSCALNVLGDIYCWGGSPYEEPNGRDGLGDGEGLNQPVSRAGQLWRSVSAGFDHTCAISVDDALYCWGGNRAGQLGIGSVSNAESMHVVEGRWLQVSAGAEYTCAISTVGQTFCWGQYQNSDAAYAAPMPVTYISESQQVSAFLAPEACAVARDGGLSCWAVGATAGAFEDLKLLKSFAGSDQWQSVSVGWGFGCAIHESSDAYCWGMNRSGQLGAGLDDDFHAVDGPIPLALQGDWSQLSAGSGESSCGIRQNLLYCWGDNLHGQLGNGTSGLDKNKFVPTPVVFD